MNYLKHIISVIILSFILPACNEDKWLEETVMDFYSPENSYTTPEQFDFAIAKIYSEISDLTYSDENYTGMLKGALADNLYHFYDPSITYSNHLVQIIPESQWVTSFWEKYYKLIFDANVVISRIDNEDIIFHTEQDREKLKAEAHFFRAFAYKNLAILYGGVPIILEEISAPKRDFVRASREEVLEQAISDFQFAATNLPEVTELEEDGRLAKAAAYHFLAETYIITQQWDKAIEASSSVINNPNYELMTERFGAWQDKPGDVFRDLFIRNNQNRNCAGGPNTEAIWVDQYEYNVTGGGNSVKGPRFYGVWYWSLQDKNDVPLFFGHSSQNGGRAFGFYANNDYLNYDIWEDDWNDMRNSSYNIRRDIVADNPESAYFGQKIIENDAILTPGPYHEFWRPYWAKLVPFDNFPEETVQNSETGATYNSANDAFTDTYLIRLSETYLLRAEAYLGEGNLALAAADINVVRARANAKPVIPAEIDIDYILDERSRELTYEELRVLTLMRLDKLVERVRQYNPYYNGKYANFEIRDYHKLWPIPQSEIERNSEATLAQNPGYNN